MKHRNVDAEDVNVALGAEARLPVRRHRPRHILFFAVLSFLIFCLLSGLLVISWWHDEEAAPSLLATTPSPDNWLDPVKHRVEWQQVLRHAEHWNIPPPHGMPLHQVLFVSCNRHDRSQLYWAYVAAAAQCEMLSVVNVLRAAPCRRLYAGLSPVEVRGKGAPTPPSSFPPNVAGGGQGGATRGEDMTALAVDKAEVVPPGACGSVYDTSAAAQHRQRTTQRLPKSASPHAVAPGLRLRVAHRGVGNATGIAHVPVPVPADALIWLGDAIYADKRADGEDKQSLLFLRSNSLTDVGRFWRTQRDAPEYNAFIETCVRRSGEDEMIALPGEGHEGHKERTEGKGRVSGVAAVDPRLIVGSSPLPAGRPLSLSGYNVWGTWDDHDMGKNDGGVEYPYRNRTQRLFLDFLRAPAGDPRWRREGVYGAYTISFRDVVDDATGWGLPMRAILQQLYVHAICVLLLDVRYFRDRPNATQAGDMLGEAQWQWVEERLQHYATPTTDERERCAMVLIGGGVQFLLDEKPAENWAAFPRSRDRLLGLVRTYRVERVAFITGDVHMGELGADFTAHAINEVMGYPMIEATSSGLTHSANMFFLPAILPVLLPTPRRVAVYVEKNFASLRLSLDLRSLQRNHPHFKEMVATEVAAAAVAKKKKGTINRPRTPQWRRDVRAVVEEVLNATFTIFSIARGGKPVFRLNFPLSMLTYAHGPTFQDATVDAFAGSVHVRSPMSTVLPEWKQKGGDAEKRPRRGAAALHPSPPASTATPAMTIIQLRNGTSRRVWHYRNSAPAPAATSFVRLVQHYILTGCTVPETLVRLALLVAALLLSATLVLLHSLWRCSRGHRLRRMGRNPCLVRRPSNPFASFLAVHSGDAAESANTSFPSSMEESFRPRWWSRHFGGWGKTKIK